MAHPVKVAETLEGTLVATLQEWEDVATVAETVAVLKNVLAMIEAGKLTTADGKLREDASDVAEREAKLAAGKST
jgi:hypothetical protein